MIWVQSANRVIGVDGGLPFSLPEDMARFKALTMGGAVIMGRATWESLPPRFRPLPGRRNVVLTRQPSWVASGALVAHSPAEALDLASGDHVRWVVGGGQVYHQFVDLAQWAEVTEVNADAPGDTLAPRLDPPWQVVARDPSTGWLTSQTGLNYRFTTLAKPPLPAA
ncbi:MAG: dihydrofolate reductase [Micrococcales bacterium]|nr:dihydrofolate reductase [Micrococcales bacterium]